MKFFAYLSIFLLSAFCVCAEGKKNTFALFSENDIGFSDRYYTNAIKFQFTNQGDDYWSNALQFAILDLFAPTANQANKRFQSVSLGQNMYVPHSISVVNPPLDDRPYAGWLYFNAASHIVSKNSLDSFAITMGIVGRHSYAEDIQCWWHDMGNFDTPMGWDTQLKDEFGFVISYKHFERLWRKGFGDSWQSDVIVSGGLDLGNVLTQATLSALLRAGYALPFTFDFNKIDYTSASDVKFEDAQSQVRIFFQIGATARFVAYDITLNGNAFVDGGRSVTPDWFVFEPVTGISVAWGALELNLNLTCRTREYRTQRINHHTYWSASLKYSF